MKRNCQTFRPITMFSFVCQLFRFFYVGFFKTPVLGVLHYSVPVVLDRESAGTRIPHSGFIAVNDFNSTDTLVEYLEYLMTNRTAYAEYFKWRLSTDAPNEFMDMSFRKPFSCGLCEKLHTDNTTKYYIDLAEWITQNSNCHPWTFKT